MNSPLPKIDLVDNRLLNKDGPAFDKPWQAQVFSLVVHLNQEGVFPWNVWAEVFSEEIKAAPARSDESINDAYYRQWLVAVERLVTQLGLVVASDIPQRTDEWRQAYLNTPHGQPVNLINASCPPPHGHHDHTPRRTPVATSQAYT
ncbi:MAG: nitrile hydratase accessory protein [Halomonas sp.]|jgi:nitrile hydratase accessory protein|nr:nitrile hydratase accessory protein [Halomonas sp.]MBL1268418.1 nitrile hydratase accessory protein [Halomonas sp.]MBL1269629.1 nitrile hydratase accessory protein [Halomonas sp.]